MSHLHCFGKGLLPAVIALALLTAPAFGATVYGAGNLDESVFANVVPAAASDFDYQLLDSLEGVVLLRYTGKAQEIILPQEIEGFPVQRIEGRAFYSTNVKTVVIPDSVVSMGREAFAQCSNLVSVRLSPTMRVISGGAFSGCSKLENVVIPPSVDTMISRAFRYTGIRSITLPPNMVFRSYADGTPIPSPEVFESCSKLETVVLPETMTVLPEKTFASCTALKEVALPPRLEVIQKDAFTSCKGLQKLVLPETLHTIEDALNGTGLVELAFPNSVKEFHCRLYSCPNLEVVRLPDSLEELEEGLFYNPNRRESRVKLRSINLPVALKKVSVTAFYGMGTLTEVLIPESLTEVEFDGKLEPDPNHPYGGLLTQTWAFLGTSLPLATQARLKKMGYYGSFR